MAWQKTKILMVSVETDDNGKKVMHRYVKSKSKGTGKATVAGKKLTLKKYNPILKKHTLYTETKYK
jgi:ribosomal protein L33